jgi:hypothetical protein
MTIAADRIDELSIPEGVWNVEQQRSEISLPSRRCVAC